MQQRLAVVRYRSRATLRHRRGSYVSLVILVGLIADLGLGSLAAARRTQSSFSTFLASTNPSDLTVSMYGGGGGSTNPDYDPALTARIAHLPDVRHVAAAVELTGAPLTPDGSPRCGSRATRIRSPASTACSSVRTVPGSSQAACRRSTAR